MYSEAFDNGFIKTEKNEIPIKINSKDRYIAKTFTTIRNIATLAKIIPATPNLPSSNLENNCFVTNTTNIFDYNGLFSCK